MVSESEILEFEDEANQEGKGRNAKAKGNLQRLSLL